MLIFISRRWFALPSMSAIISFNLHYLSLLLYHLLRIIAVVELSGHVAWFLQYQLYRCSGLHPCSMSSSSNSSKTMLPLSKGVLWGHLPACYPNHWVGTLRLWLLKIIRIQCLADSDRRYSNFFIFSLGFWAGMRRNACIDINDFSCLRAFSSDI